ncbi:MAG: alpha/beta fold hydrolase [Candidatus Obscuribacterales bacterium]|nr:alpha/beta fold hydrolase [Candidatus Obscuribacterales bacterium]
MSADSNKELDRLFKTTIFGRRITIDVSGETIVGNLHEPQGESPGAPVLLLHGLGGSRQEHNGLFLRTAALLAASGFTVLRIDFRGHGESSGFTLSCNPESLIEDALIGVSFLRELPGCQDKKVSLLGLSLGGLVAALTTRQSDDIGAMVLWEAPFNLIETFTRLLGPFSFEKVRARGYLQAGMIQISDDFVEGFAKRDCRELMADVSIPSLIVQGREDKIVLFEDADRWRHALRSSACEVVYIAGGDHAFPAEDHAYQVIETTRAWLVNAFSSK